MLAKKEEKIPAKKRELPDSQDLAAAMLKRQQKDKKEIERKAANDNQKDPLAKFRPNPENDVLAKFRHIK